MVFCIQANYSYPYEQSIVRMDCVLEFGKLLALHGCPPPLSVGVTFHDPSECLKLWIVLNPMYVCVDIYVLFFPIHMYP